MIDIGAPDQGERFGTAANEAAYGAKFDVICGQKREARLRA
jgi:hypothetical protein